MPIRRGAGWSGVSGRGELNPRPPAPKAGALHCATPRLGPRGYSAACEKRAGPRRYTRAPHEVHRRAPRGQQGEALRRGRRERVRKGESTPPSSKIAREVRIPGFRPGKAPRKLLEARLGTDVGRERGAAATRCPSTTPRRSARTRSTSSPPPRSTSPAGEEDGDVAFDAVVEIRPAGRASAATTACGSRSPTPRPPTRRSTRRSTACASSSPSSRRSTARPSTATTSRSTSPARRTASPSPASPPTTTSTRSAPARSCPSSTSSCGRQGGDILEFDADAPGDPDEDARRVPHAREGGEGEGPARARPTSGPARRPSSTPLDELRADLAKRIGTGQAGPGPDGPAREAAEASPSWSRTSSPTPSSTARCRSA